MLPRDLEPDLPLLLGLVAQLRPQLGDFLRQLSRFGRQALSQLDRFFRNRTMVVQAVLPSSRLKPASSKAPWLHGHYPASQLLWASPTPDPGTADGYVFPPAAWPLRRPGRVSQVPGLIFRRTPSPTTPESPTVAGSRFFTAGAGFTLFGRLAALTWRHEAETGSLALRLTSSPFEASLKRIAPLCARLATCVTSNSHGELLSVHKINQA